MALTKSIQLGLVLVIAGSCSGYLPSPGASSATFAATKRMTAAQTFPSPTSFAPSFPWPRNEHLQTIGGAFLRKTSDSWRSEGGFESSRVRINAGRDWFHVDRIVRQSAKQRPPKIVVQLHGLESTSTSPLCESMARAFALTGGADQIHTVCFRGCSGEPNDTAGAYHLGFTDDLKLYLEELKKLHPEADVFLSGFSLGANAVLKALGELGPAAADLNVRGAAVTCVPFNCELCQPRLDASGFNRNVYSRNFLNTLKMKTESQYERGLLDGVPRFSIERVRAATTIGEFDDAVVAPVYGFEDKIDYYRKSSCAQYLNAISVPFLVVNANDDPFFDKGCYVRDEDVNTGLMRAIYTEHGGHCAFMGGKGEGGDGWMETTLARFIRHVCVYDGDENDNAS